MFLTGTVLLVLQWERPVGDLRMLFWGVPAAAVLYGALGTLTFRSPLLARLGEWSYALYLTHVFVITLYIKHIISAVTTVELPWQVHYLIMTILTLAGAAAYHMVVEAPLSRWTLRSLRRPRAGLEPDRPADNRPRRIAPPLSGRARRHHVLSADTKKRGRSARDKA
jgi:exopolysaccharide production protein ExoZ